MSCRSGSLLPHVTWGTKASAGQHASLKVSSDDWCKSTFKHGEAVKPQDLVTQTRKAGGDWFSSVVTAVADNTPHKSVIARRRRTYGLCLPADPSENASGCQILEVKVISPSPRRPFLVGAKIFEQSCFCFPKRKHARSFFPSSKMFL